jgi:hypothetical protein
MPSSTSIIQNMLDSSKYPTSFEGNYWIFAGALFCTMVAALVSLSQIYFIGKEMVKIPDKPKHPINIYRWELILAYLTILLAVGPDAIYLWTYGELTSVQTQMVLTVDRIFDSLFLIPFAAFTWLQIRCGAVLKFQLLRNSIPVDIRPSSNSIKTNVFCAILIMLMAIGVTFSK